VLRPQRVQRMDNARLARFQGESHVGKPRLHNTLCFLDHCILWMQHDEIIGVPYQVWFLPFLFAVTVMYSSLQAMQCDVC
jgi:hypothetical protein